MSKASKRSAGRLPERSDEKVSKRSAGTPPERSEAKASQRSPPERSEAKASQRSPPERNDAKASRRSPGRLPERDDAKASEPRTAPFPALPALGVSAHWRAGEAGLELVGLAKLLAALGESPRMAAAARGLDVSYRTAWGRLVAAENALGVQLVTRIKGHGSQLMPAGRQLVEAVTRFEHHARARLAEPLAALGADLGRLRPGRARAALRIAASHDLLLQRCLAERRVEGMTIRFVGSDDALRALACGEADLAGFHRPTGERALPGKTLGEGRAVFIAPLALREQGLIVARGNPLRIRDVADLARSGLRFVNRQRGAATRTWLDRLLSQGGIAPERIAGYEVEEPTHLAVAATVAAGGADAGFGLRAAADRFDLGFVSIGRETYWLAGLLFLRRDPRVTTLIKAVKQLADETDGYDSPTHGRGVFS